MVRSRDDRSSARSFLRPKDCSLWATGGLLHSRVLVRKIAPTPEARCVAM